MKNILSLIGAGLIGGLMVVGATKLSNRNVNVAPNSSFTHLASDKVALPGSLDLSNAAAVASPTVVYIEAAESKENAQRRAQEEYSNDPFAQFFGGGFSFRQPQKKGTGSGVIISGDGYIVTNNHVVDFADNVNVTLSDNRKFTANVVGTDPTADLAVLKINTTGLPAIQKGNSENLKIGEWVLAIGFPYDIGTTVTAGIVSATHKNLKETRRDMEDFIQTDAVVNPGNSGGALVDANGKLIGINTAIQTRTGSYEGYSFAIPMNKVNTVVEDIIKNGGKKKVLPKQQLQAQSSKRPRLGISMVADQFFDEVAKEKELDVNAGVIVDQVEDGSAAQYAGILPNDVIVKINSNAVRSTLDVRQLVSDAKTGETLKVLVFRNGKTKEITVTLKS
jgi:serine protease Do